jgi:CYTH domain-containing protein
MKSTRDPSNLEYNDIQELAVSSIICSEIGKLILISLDNWRTTRTRSIAVRQSKIEAKWKEIRLKGRSEECHLVLSFAEDVKRSLRELNYVIENASKNK